MTDLIDDMIEKNISPEEWKAALVYYNTFTADAERGKLPIFQTNQTYKDYKKMNLNAVKGNYMVQVGNVWVEKPNSWLAQTNAEAYMDVQILEFEKRYKDENDGKEPTFKERSEFMNQMRTLLVESFTPDNVSPNLESFTVYEEAVKEQLEVERVKQVEYKKVGVNEAVASAIQVISDNSAAFKPLLQKVRDTFKESFLGIGWDTDSAFGETDAESLARITTERLPQFLADSGIFDNIFTQGIKDTISQPDFDKLKNDMATNLTSQLGWTMTTDMVDQMIQLLIPKKE